MLIDDLPLLPLSLRSESQEGFGLTLSVTARNKTNEPKMMEVRGLIVIPFCHRFVGIEKAIFPLPLALARIEIA